MSLETWKEEFYKIAVQELDILYLSDIELTEHCLIKWKGLTDDNLLNHGVEKVEGDSDIVDDFSGKLQINSTSCALCANVKARTGEFDCKHCPIHQTLGHDCLDAYTEWEYGGGPDSMIEVLKHTLKQLENRENP